MAFKAFGSRPDRPYPNFRLRLVVFILVFSFHLDSTRQIPDLTRRNRSLENDHEPVHERVWHQKSRNQRPLPMSLIFFAQTRARILFASFSSQFPSTIRFDSMRCVQACQASQRAKQQHDATKTWTGSGPRKPPTTTYLPRVCMWQLGL